MRYLAEPIATDALTAKKMAFISGPRQVGKTTLAKSFLDDASNYHSWDQDLFRRAWSKSPAASVSRRAPGPLVLDEIHKDRRWKTRLKGLYDEIGATTPIIVTGSARLDLFRRGGDSMQGRYFPYRLHPFTCGESATPPHPDQVFEPRRPVRPWRDLLLLGGFPEPFTVGSEAKAKRWSRLRADRLIKEDVRDVMAVMDLQAMRVLADLLPSRAASLLSINALREDVGASYATVYAWMQVLEALYVWFPVRPYSKKIARALRAEPKLFLFDQLRVPRDDEAKQLENLTALHLLKATQYWTDAAVAECELRFVRDKQKREVDFLVLREGTPWLLVECKTRDLEPSASLLYFRDLLKVPHAVQLVDVKGHDREFPGLGVRVISYERFFSAWV